ncbi:Tyrosine/DOPA decarboxylase 1 [Acorus calamus]|uniref:Tyrosine/DOPA decarboxylase 1 n=1 Tax=Acorus calamus TaxID=4465 RepID=A0AAV9FHT4_ACOCL|nr:Tyrosine/DOPA decarboxylase 1 [Acorus calamus]
MNASRRAFMTHAVVEGKYVLRMAVGASLKEERHVLGAWKVIQEMADGIVSEEDQWCFFNLNANQMVRSGGGRSGQYDCPIGDDDGWRTMSGNGGRFVRGDGGREDGGSGRWERSPYTFFPSEPVIGISAPTGTPPSHKPESSRHSSPPH